MAIQRPDVVGVGREQAPLYWDAWASPNDVQDWQIGMTEDSLVTDLPSFGVGGTGKSVAGTSLPATGTGMLQPKSFQLASRGELTPPAASVSGVKAPDLSQPLPQPQKMGVQVPEGGAIPVTPEAQAAEARIAAGVPQETAKTSAGLGAGAQIGIGAAQVGVDMLSNIADARRNLSANEYLYDLNYWKQQGKEWFDPMAETMPSWAEYNQLFPSKVESMKEASMTGSPTADFTIQRGLQGASAGAAIGTMVAPGVGTAVGALIGAGVGSLTGLIEGLFSMSDAKKRDEKEQSRAYIEYKNKLKQWTYNMTRKRRAETAGEVTRRKGEALAMESMGRQRKIETEDRNQRLAKEARQDFMNLFATAGKLREKRALETASRWA